MLTTYLATILTRGIGGRVSPLEGVGHFLDPIVIVASAKFFNLVLCNPTVHIVS